MYIFLCLILGFVVPIYLHVYVYDININNEDSPKTCHEKNLPTVNKKFIQLNSTSIFHKEEKYLQKHADVHTYMLMQVCRYENINFCCRSIGFVFLFFFPSYKTHLYKNIFDIQQEVK